MGTTPPLSDEDYLALCVWDEARGEPYEGKVAVAEVVTNRANLHYSSDGTIRGTVLRRNQFSGFYFDFVDGRYQRVCHDEDAADARAHRLLAQAHKEVSYVDCLHAARHEVRPGIVVYVDRPVPKLPRQLPEAAVLYYNPAVVHMPPAWATPDKLVTTIGHHAFYRA